MYAPTEGLEVVDLLDVLDLLEVELWEDGSEVELETVLVFVVNEEMLLDVLGALDEDEALEDVDVVEVVVVVQGGRLTE